MQHPSLTLTAKARQRWIGYDRLVLADAGRQRIGIDKDAGFEQLRMFQCQAGHQVRAARMPHGMNIARNKLGSNLDLCT